VTLRSDDLKTLMAAADEDPNKVGEALHGLLEAKVYVYVRLDSSAEEAGLFQFHHPRDGQLMVPFFTDERRAADNAPGQFKVLAYPCRQFFEQTLGSVLLLDPKGRDFVLYPNEVAALLAGVYTSGPLPVPSGDFGSVAVADVPAALPLDLAKALRALYESLPAVHACHVSMLHQEGGLTPSVLLIICNAEPGAHADVKRTTLEAVRPFLQTLGLPIDLLMLAPQNNLANYPAWCLYERP
jgi:hypothetical protein